MKTTIALALLVVFSAGLAVAGETSATQLSRDQFDLIRDTVDELDELATKLDAIRTKLRNRRDEMNEKIEQVKELPTVKKEEPIPSGHLLCFTAPWCGPCNKDVKPAIKLLAKSGWTEAEYPSEKKVNFVMVDWDKYATVEDQGLPKSLINSLGLEKDIQILPTLVKIEDGVEVWRHEGGLGGGSDTLNVHKLVDLYIGTNRRKTKKE